MVPDTVEPDELLGTWQLTRRIVQRPHDGTRQRFGRVEGTLALTADGDEVDWAESGTLQWDGAALAVARRLRIRRRGGSGWVVHFDDDRPFHPWRTGRPVVHRCGDDVYRGLLAVAADRRSVRVFWAVRGPGKDLWLFTRCWRPSGRDARDSWSEPREGSVRSS